MKIKTNIQNIIKKLKNIKIKVKKTIKKMKIILIVILVKLEIYMQ